MPLRCHIQGAQRMINIVWTSADVIVGTVFDCLDSHGLLQVNSNSVFNILREESRFKPNLEGSVLDVGW